MSSSSGTDAVIVGLTVFVLSFAILSGTGINLGNVPGVRERVSARTVRLMIALAFAIAAVIFVVAKP